MMVAALNADHKKRQQSSERQSHLVTRFAPVPTTDPLVLQSAIDNPQSASPQAMLQLQRDYGNRAVSRLIQAKLRVGPADDPYEREADHVADQVMRTPGPPPQSTAQRDTEEDEILTKPLVQRQEDEDEIHTKRLVQREFEDEDDLYAKRLTPPIVNRKSPIENPNDGFDTDDSFDHSLSSSRGGGSPLPADLRADFEPKFGADFSGVRVHTDSRAADLNRQISAQAFTHGNNIFFGAGKYNPVSGSGKHLIAHELTHTVQQGAAGLQPKRLASHTPGLKISAGGGDTVQRWWNPFKWIKNLFKRKKKGTGTGTEETSRTKEPSDYTKMITSGQSGNAIDDRERAIFEDAQNVLSNDPLSTSKGVPFTTQSRELAKKHGLTADELAALRIYTSDSYKVINPVLYGSEEKLKSGIAGQLGIKVDEVTQEMIEKYTARAQQHTETGKSSLDKLPPYEGMVYRGIRAGRLFDSHHEGETIEYKNFMSTSTDIRQAIKFSGGGHAVAHMQSKSGRSVKDFSYFRSEGEVLFKPDTKFRVEKISDFHTSGLMGYRYSIKMTEV